MHIAIEQALLRSWMSINTLSCLLLPVALCMKFLVFFRRSLYQLGVLKSEKVDATVVVVGNVIAGGAGKTPTVIELVQHLKSKGIACGVVSRGYASNNAHCQEVSPQTSALEVGDEPLLIYRKTGIPVVIGKNRTLAAKSLLGQHPNTKIIICDDGLQHYQLYRDIEICVFDNRGYGNGLMLPAGPLREAWPRVTLPSVGQNSQCSIVLHTGSKPAFDGFRALRKLADTATDCKGNQFPLYELRHRSAKPLIAVAGIAQPEVFFEMLRSAGILLQQTIPLPDHYDFKNIKNHIPSDVQVICTEKDAAKLWRHLPQALSVGLQQTSEPDFFKAFDNCLQQASIDKLSSHHGHQAT